MSDGGYEPEQVDYALRVLAECDGSATAAAERLDGEHHDDKIAFSVPVSTLREWKNVSRTADYERIRAKLHTTQEAETIAELRAAAHRAAQLTSRALTAVEARLPQAAAREAAAIAQSMAKAAEISANVVTKLEGARVDDPQESATDMLQAIRDLGPMLKLNGTISASLAAQHFPNGVIDDESGNNEDDDDVLDFDEFGDGDG